MATAGVALATRTVEGGGDLHGPLTHPRNPRFCASEINPRALCPGPVSFVGGVGAPPRPPLILLATQGDSVTKRGDGQY